MSQTTKKSKGDPPSIHYRLNPVEGASYEIAGVIHEQHAPTFSKNYELESKTSERTSSQILSTAELVSAVGQVFDYTSSLFQHKGNSDYKICDGQKKDILDILKWETDDGTSSLAENKCIYYSGLGDFSRLVQSRSDIFSIVHGTSLLKSKHEIFSQPLLRRIMGRGTRMPIGPWEEKELCGLGILYGRENIYGRMVDLISSGGRYPTTENNKVDNCIPETKFSSIVESRPGEEKIFMNCLGAVVADPGFGHSKNLASVDKTKLLNQTRGSICSDYFLDVIESVDTNNNALATSSSSLCSDYCLNPPTSENEEHEQRSRSSDSNERFKSNEEQHGSFVLSDEKCKTKNSSAAPLKSDNAFAKQEHAFAGAFAGVCVSLCLHPVDTVKTVIQSCHATEKSLFYIGQSIVSERGLSGLYRGISSNIASSAPISAVYTFTYESVKGALLPLFPKEYCSVAHCLAGGCASIATSFIFTPSERIKQQMQVGSHYQNCWHALIGIIRKGGLPSLYAGWGAVLCRNIPHSVIKFYTYESLKQWMLTSVQSGAQPSTSGTLVCGGLAGSTAALFTTPFDVVKTRLQTQTPGTCSRYDGVFHALQEIRKHEGLRGLYRGLTPRLVMYISQGALFFSSYEFFKRLFILEDDLMV